MLQVKRERALSRGIHRARQQKQSLELIVKVNSSKVPVARELERIGKVKHIFEFVPYISFQCQGEDAEHIRKAVHNNGSRAYRALGKLLDSVEISGKVSLPKPRKSGNSNGMWNLENIGVYYAQQVSLGEGTSIAVIDTGVDYEHPEVSGNFEIRKGYNFVDDNEPLDDNGHGTHVAGIIAGGNYGIAREATLFSLKVLNQYGEGSEADSIAAVEWALKNNVDIANMSLGSPVASGAFEDICYYAASKGLILVAASGNEGYGASYPAAFDEAVIAVAAVDRHNRHADFSNIYETNDISAPGVDITSSYLGGYATLSGTSMAAPHVSGVLGLATAIARGKDIEEVMEETALPLGDKEEFGAGLLRADRLVNAAERMDYAKMIFNTVKNLVW